jgi:hypothetical protein
MGVLPNVFLHPMEASVNRVIQRITDRQPARVQVTAPRSGERAGRVGGQP